MPDLIERLRNRASCGLHMGAEHGQTVFQLKEAADALEAMRDALQDALDAYQDGTPSKAIPAIMGAIQKATGGAV